MNRLYFGDNLRWLSDWKEFPDASVDLVYLVASFVQAHSIIAGGTLHFLAGYKDGLSALETICKIAALIIGGIWAWKGFIRNRLRFPSATLEHMITSWTDENKTFLHVTVRISNTGNILIKLAKGKTWIEKLTPLPSKVKDSVRTGNMPIQTGKHEINWSLIAKHELMSSDRIEIEPKETDELHFDFVIDKKIMRALIYTHLENQTKGLRKKIGWNLSSIYAIDRDKKTMPQRDEQGDERRLPSVDPEDLPEPLVVDPMPPLVSRDLRRRSRNRKTSNF
jgi:hypothetical protein